MNITKKKEKKSTFHYAMHCAKKNVEIMIAAAAILNFFIQIYE